MFTLPDVEVTIQKDPKVNRLRLSCHSYSFKGVHDLFNQKLGFFFTTNFRARSFCPSFIYLLTTRSIPQRIILSLFPYRLCPSLNRGVARFFKKGSQRQTKGTHQIVIYRPSRCVLPIITLHNNAYKGGGGGGRGNRRHATWVPKNPREIPQLRSCYTVYIHYLIVINFLREINFEKLSLAASNF